MSVPCECYVLSVVEVSETGSSRVDRSPTECGVSECTVETSTMRRLSGHVEKMEHKSH